MRYVVHGLEPALFHHLVGADAETLARHNAMRVTAMTDRGWPCRISLEDASAGESLILLHHLSHDVPTPFRSSYAIYIREKQTVARTFHDAVPPAFEGRPIALRGFDAGGMLHDAALALPGEADARIRALFANPAIAYLHAHNAAHGCFAAAIERQ